MADTFTTNLNLTKPEVGASTDTWGTKLNADLDTVDGLFSSTGTSVAMNLDGAVIDSSVIGGTTAAAGSFTTLSASTSITGTLATAAQPNITSVGTLTGLDVAGTPTFDGLTVDGSADISGTITAGANNGVIKEIGSDLSLVQGAVGLRINDASSAISPTTASSNNDNAVDLGVSNIRFKDIYLSGKLTNDGSGGISVDSSGNVGIGTTSPSALLGLNASAPDFTMLQSDSVKFRMGVSGTTNGGVTGSASGDYFARTAGGKMLFSTNDGVTAHAVINSSGNVGIGTSSPSKVVHVKASSDSSGTPIIGLSPTATDNIQGGIGCLAGGEFQVIGTNQTSFYTGSAERMRIDSSGNVGIGTSSPAQKIHISGTGFSYLRTTSASYGGTGFDIGQHTGGSIYLNNRDNTPIIIQTNNTERMRIDSSGSVGIGTASPATSSAGLHVVHDATEGTPSFPAGEVIIAQRNFNASQGADIAIISGSQSGSSINFGDKDNSQAGRIQYDNNNDAFRFFTNGSNERMRLDSSGSLLVGTTSAIQSDNTMSIAGGATGSGSAVVDIRNTSTSDNTGCISLSKGTTTTTSANRYMWFFANNFGTNMGSIGGNGVNNVAFVASSDERLKENIQPITGSLDKILALNPVSYTWKENKGHIEAGFVAQEVEQILPEYVTTEEDEMETKGITGGMTGGYIAVLTKAIQEQQTQIDALQSEINLLKGE